MARARNWIVLPSLIGLLAACGDEGGADPAPALGGSGFVPAAGGAGAGGAGTSATAGTGGAGGATVGASGSGGVGGSAGGAGGAGAGGAGAGGSGGSAGGGGAGAGAGGAGSGTDDPCEAVANACEDEGRECDDETLVICAENADGCLVETRTNCVAAATDVCDEGASPPSCKPDPCVTAGGDLKTNACAEVGTSCAGDVLVTCERDSAGCPIAERTDCTDDGNNNACLEDGDEAECVDDPCVGLSNRCEDEGLTCRDGQLVSCAERGADDCLLERLTNCAAQAGQTCDDSGATPRCDDCQDECATAGTSCQGDELRTCGDVDEDDCLELTRETCGDSCDPEDGCVFTVTCDGPTAAPGPIHATLQPGSSNGEYDTEGAGDDFSAFGCWSGNESGPDLLFAVDVPADTIATVTLDGVDFASGAPILLSLTDCSDDGNDAEDSCGQGDASATSVTFINDLGTTERVYVVVDAGAAANFGTFGLDLDLHEVECGDGVRDQGEQCDDGNVEGGDGCSASCRVSNGYACTSVLGERSACTSRPTDGRCGVLRCALPLDAPTGSELCCTVDETCGLAFSDAYGDACIGLDQPGVDDNGCGDAQGSLGWPTMNGCCRDDDDQCGLRAGPGVGCVLRSEVWTALQDGPGNLYTGGPFTDEDCN